MQILLTTTGTASPIVLGDLNDITFTHPVSNFNLLDVFDLAELELSEDLFDAIDSGYIEVEDDLGHSITTSEDLSPVSDIYLEGWQGMQGNQGWQGSGPQGNQGWQGIGNVGYQGAQGFQGCQGIAGAQGWQGNQGNQGNQGFQGPGNGYQATATGNTTTTSTADVLVSDMTLTPASGTYMVWFAFSFSNNSGGIISYFSIYAGGSKVEASEQRVDLKKANDMTGFCCTALVSVNGSQAIEGRWRVEIGTTGTMYQRTLMILKVV